MTLLSRVVDAASAASGRRKGRSDRLEELLAILTRDPTSDSQAEIARRLGTTEGNVRVAVHRLRRRYGLAVAGEEIAATVGDEAQIDDEIRDLFSALGDEIGIRCGVTFAAAIPMKESGMRLGCHRGVGEP